jgi:hypothetical protein
MTNDTKKVVVTGGSGKAGRVCVGDLIAHGYQRFRGGAAPWNQEYRLGFERDSPWIAVRYAATLRSGG